ncbi:MAG: single-stranded-DNA-specific exonuclease RecJ [Pseudomonadota bacterium]
MRNGDADRPFLGVGRSLTGRTWRARPHSARSAQAISQQAGLPDLLGRVLAARNVEPADVQSFLSPSLRELMPDPSSLVDMDKAAERLASAIENQVRIAIIGDYDVDGTTSSTLLLNYLGAVGLAADVHIPNRLTEGYGPNREAITSLKERGAELLITVDCGIRAHDPLEHAAELGLDVLIVDHHQADEVLPRASAVINPNRLDDLSGQGHLAAVGVTFLLVAAVNRTLRARGWFERQGTEAPDLMAWLDLVALGTVCDVVPLTGVNRAYVTQGLKVMSQRRNLGISCLADAARLSRRPDAHALAFLLGPRINAAGRLGQSELAIRLLRAEHTGDAKEAAQALEQLNRQRQEIELRLVDEAVAQAEKSLGSQTNLPIVIVAGDQWHPGVLGLVASRLKERFARPALAIGYDSAGVGTGSGRSIAGVDLGAAVTAAVEAGVLEKGGGHAMAAGLTVRKEQLGSLRAFMEEALQDSALKAISESALEMDGALSAGGATMELIDRLECAGPFGAGNPQPVFAFPAHRIAYADVAGSDHVRCQLVAGDGKRLKAIAFRSMGTELGEMLLSERQMPLHVAGRLAANDWGGSRSPQLLIDDLAVPSGPPG